MNINRMKNRLAAVLLLGALTFLALPDKVSAAQAQGLPWEGPLAKLQASLSGPVAGAISIIAIVICGAALIFGGEINEFTKKMIFVVLVVSVIAGAVTLYDTFWGASAALI